MTLMRAVMSIGRNAGGIVPQGMSLILMMPLMVTPTIT
jgi:phage gp29-like protein